MKLSLQARLGQQLNMTTQLHQTIKLLQLSNFDLRQEVGQMLESNPLLEAEESGDEAANGAGDRTLTGESWPEHSFARQGAPSWSGDFEPSSSQQESLQDHLLWQLNLTPMSDRDHAIALAIVDAIDPNGMLSVDIDSLVAGFAADANMATDEVLAVLHRIQRFDPVGVGARDLGECLLLQLDQCTDPALEQQAGAARQIVRDHLGLLASHDYPRLMRKVRLNEEQLGAAVKLIESLNPRPGAHICPATAPYVIPDVIVSRDPACGAWRVDLNPESAPRVRIHSDYAALASSSCGEEAKYLRSNLQEARWFLKSLQNRNETLMKVAAEIVERQQDFLEHGEEAMKPLVLHDIAEAVEMHESTISRVTTQKYLHTPRGVFELKYFFSSHVTTEGGEECSSTAIRAIIRKLVAKEHASKPCSDSEIAALLGQRGIRIARRTVAKYRESLSIPPSRERKRLAPP